jgi:hypothetical protein
MLIGGAIGGAVLILFSVVLGGSLRAFFGALTAGAVGGIMSVLVRLTTGDLRLKRQLGSRLISLAGSARPFIGATLGGAVYLLTVGKIVVSITKADDIPDLVFAGGIGFVGGFFERAARDFVSTPLKTDSPEASNEG